MPTIPVSSSLTQINAELFLQEGFELSLDAIIPSIELTGSYTPFESKTQFYIYNYAKEILYSNLNYNADGSFLSSPSGTSTSNSTSSYNQFELTPTEDIYNQGYSNGNYYAVYNFINYELGSETKIVSNRTNTVGSGAQSAYYDTYSGHPYFIKDISGDRTELRIQNNYLSSIQIENYYNTFKNKIDLRENADEFYVSFGDNRNFIAVNSQLEVPVTGSSNVTSILIKLYKPLPAEFKVDKSIQIISKVGETQAFEVQFKPNLQFIDNLLSLKGPNYNIDLKDRVNNSTNFKSLDDLINTNSSQSYYQLNSLQDERGVILRKNWADWSQFVKYSSAEKRLSNFQSKMTSIENYEAELANLSTINAPSQTTTVFSSSYNGTSEKINQIITKFDSYEYFLYYITGSESWPKYDSTYPYPNYSVTSSEALNWLGSTDEQSQYYNTGKNQIYSASRYDNNNQDYLYYLIPPFITENSSNDQYTNFVNMTGQAFDEMYLYTEAVEQVRNTNSGLTGSVLPLDLADEVITSLGFDTYANSFNSTGFNVNTVGVLPSAGSGLEYITRYIDIASGSVINYYDQQQSTLGYVVALADPSFPYPLDNAAQEIYKRIFHNMVSLVKRKGTVTGLRQLINIWGVPSTMLRISEFGGKNKNDENDYDLWMNRYSNAITTYSNASSSFVGGTTAFINNIFINPGSSWDGIDPADTSLYAIDWYIVTDQTITAPTPSATITQRFVQTSDVSFQDQLVGVSGTSVAYWEGASATNAEKAANLAQAMNSANSTISSLGNAYNVGGIINFQYNAVGAGGNFGQVYVAGNNLKPQMYSTSRQGFNGTNSSIINDSTKPSGSIRIPWQPLTGNYVDGNSPSPDYYSVPDCIQFRFKPQQPTSATANFSQSLLVKGNLYDEEADFAITLSYTGSQSGSFSGSVLPNNSQYGNLIFYLSGSLIDNGTVRTTPITLPFFDGNWWSVQLQRLTNISASNDNFTQQTWELRTANNIYDGYNGNQIGFSGKKTITKPSINPSYNFAWNTTHGVTALSPSGNSFAKGYSAIALGGMMQSPGAPNQFMGTSQWSPASKINIGDGFLGDFQEFRYYRRALSASQFNDYVMNPESIQGHADANTGAGSSYDLLSFRLPLGNELEYTEVSGSATGHDWNNAQGGQVKFLSFGGNSFFAGKNAFGSLHPSLVNKQGSLFTSSFITTANVTSSQYGIAYQGRTGAYTNAITASYLIPNTEINYMDQPAAGIRNRIKNKIQVIDGNEYGTTLSPFRSIQQEFEQSSSYTEDLNSLEVGFSFQNEINDDIIATFGHGVVSDAIADPRFISESSDRYPELTRIAEDYFKKYQGVTVDDPTYNGGLPTTIEKEYDYNRLIKFYETSLFKAIKNYVPARTSLSTGIIVKQHLLERNKTDAVVGININTPMAKTPETGSDSWGYTTQTGFNSVMSQQNLLITSSINMYSLTGSAGGSVNKYNIVPAVTSSIYLTSISLQGTTLDTTPQRVDFGIINSNVHFMGVDGTGQISLIRSSISMTDTPKLKINFSSPSTTGFYYTVKMYSNVRGLLDEKTTQFFGEAWFSFSEILLSPWEGLYFTVEAGASPTNTNTISNIEAFFGGSTLYPSYLNFINPPLVTPPSQQSYQYLDNFTGEYKAKNTQEEFYNGEYSGSNLPVELNEYNPYRIYADGNDITPDTELPYVDFTLGGGDAAYWNITSTNTIEIQSGYTPTPAFKYWTGSFQNLQIGETYTLNYTIVVNNTLGGIVMSQASPTTISWFGGQAIYSSGTYNHTFIATDDRISGITDSGGPYSYFYIGGSTMTLTVNSIVGGSIGPKHFYERDSFTIIPTSSWLFQNSPYNPIINNVSGSRKNSFLFDQDFDPVTPTINFTEGIPNDYALVISASQLGWEGVATADNLLEYSEVPDSNYTTTAIINPRYNGSKITSADYNFGISEMNLSESAAPNAIISPLRLPGLQKSSKIRFLNGETGSWKGDSTNEYPSAIDTRPIYFAHFKSSYENYELYNSTTFDIDQLIQVPFDSIQSEQAPIITSSQLNGNNENLVAVGSTFTPNRKSKAFYNQSTKQFRNLKKYLSPSNYTTISPTLDYTIADNNSNYIIFPAQEVLSYYTNEKTQQEVVVTHSINAPIWVKDSINYNPTIGAGRPIWQVINTSNNDVTASINYPLTQSIQPLPLNTFSASTSLLVTGSSPNGDLKGYGLLYLQGMAIKAENLYEYNFGPVSPVIRSFNISAPHLQLINSINHNIDIGDISYSTSQNPYTFPDETINTQITNSCAQWPPNEGDPFAPWPFTVSTFVQSPINPTANTNYRLGGGLPSFPSNPLKSTATKGIQNYFTYNYSMSVLTEYTEKILPIMIERGDEIRVSYAYPLLTDAVSNASKTNEIITQTFQVLGYEQAPPSLLFGKPLKYNGTSQLGWSSNEAMVATFGVGSNEFEAIAGNLPPTGLYSPDSLKERFDLLATNQQNVIGLGLSTNDTWLNAFTGSIVSCKVESRWGEISGSSTTVAPTGSIRVKFRGYQGAIASNANRVCQIQSVQEILRTTMGGASGSYQDLLVDPPPTSQYTFIGGEDQGQTPHPLNPAFIFDTLKVTPNPATLAKPIPNGSIMSATFKKRIDNDTKVVINVTQPPGNEGALTPSGDGYLIPDDLTSTQMDNVQKIINVLKSQNSFTNPPDANETQDVS
jgi:hypothetical protein